jgi:hypothetical protein
MGTVIEPIPTVATQKSALPYPYTIVPAVALNQSKEKIIFFVARCQERIAWLKNAVEYLRYSWCDM